jgi:hypothetical protein
MIFLQGEKRIKVAHILPKIFITILKIVMIFCPYRHVY